LICCSLTTNLLDLLLSDHESRDYANLSSFLVLNLFEYQNNDSRNPPDSWSEALCGIFQYPLNPPLPKVSEGAGREGRPFTHQERETTMQLDHLMQQLNFIVEIDKLKEIIRRTYITSAQRRENSAEHSWHLAMMAIVLAEHANQAVELLRVLKMLLIHDIVEIDAGDTFLYDKVGNLDKAAREEKAADRLFGLLPQEQAHATAP
jgi:hypothetical protein